MINALKQAQSKKNNPNIDLRMFMNFSKKDLQK